MVFFFSLCVFQGYVEAGAEQCLCVLYLPGALEVFVKRLRLQVAFLPPQEITVTGEGVFPQISLNLPRNLCMHTNAQYTDMIVSICNKPKEEILDHNIHVLFLFFVFLLYGPK